MDNQLKMDYLKGCYLNGKKNERGMCAIQAFVLAGEFHLPVPEWAMQEVGQRFNAYWRANTAEGMTGQLSLDSFFETQRAFQRINTETRNVERTDLINRFEKLFDLQRDHAIAVLEAAELISIETKEKKGQGKIQVRSAKSHVVNRSSIAKMSDAYKKLFQDKVNNGTIDLEATRQYVKASLPEKAQELINSFQRKK